MFIYIYRALVNHIRVFSIFGHMWMRCLHLCVFEYHSKTIDNDGLESV